MNGLGKEQDESFEGDARHAAKSEPILTGIDSVTAWTAITSAHILGRLSSSTRPDPSPPRKADEAMPRRSDLCAHDTPRWLCDCERWQDRYPSLYAMIVTYLTILGIQAAVIGGIILAVTV